MPRLPLREWTYKKIPKNLTIKDWRVAEALGEIGWHDRIFIVQHA